MNTVTIAGISARSSGRSIKHESREHWRLWCSLQRCHCLMVFTWYFLWHNSAGSVRAHSVSVHYLQLSLRLTDEIWHFSQSSPSLVILQGKAACVNRATQTMRVLCFTSVRMPVYGHWRIWHLHVLITSSALITAGNSRVRLLVSVTLCTNSGISINMQHLWVDTWLVWFFSTLLCYWRHCGEQCGCLHSFTRILVRKMIISLLTSLLNDAFFNILRG